jgi:hypothetical protein
MPLDQAAEGYKIFNEKRDHCEKIVHHLTGVRPRPAGGGGAVPRAAAPLPRPPRPRQPGVRRSALP